MSDNFRYFCQMFAVSSFFVSGCGRSQDEYRPACYEDEMYVSLHVCVGSPDRDDSIPDLSSACGCGMDVEFLHADLESTDSRSAVIPWAHFQAMSDSSSIWWRELAALADFTLMFGEFPNASSTAACENATVVFTPGQNRVALFKDGEEIFAFEETLEETGECRKGDDRVRDFLLFLEPALRSGE